MLGSRSNNSCINNWVMVNHRLFMFSYSFGLWFVRKLASRWFVLTISGLPESSLNKPWAFLECNLKFCWISGKIKEWLTNQPLTRAISAIIQQTIRLISAKGTILESSSKFSLAIFHGYPHIKTSTVKENLVANVHCKACLRRVCTQT